MTNVFSHTTRRRVLRLPLALLAVALDSPPFPRRRVGLASVCSLVAALLLGGCVSSGLLSPPGGGVATEAPPPTMTTTGQIATTADVSGWTGIVTAMPVGLALLLGFDKWLSHRREMGRIKGRNGNVTN